IMSSGSNHNPLYSMTGGYVLIYGSSNSMKRQEKHFNCDYIDFNQLDNMTSSGDMDFSVRGNTLHLRDIYT
ncbi:hypothetical protein ACJX0J_031408, partial [Zea mays]